MQKMPMKQYILHKLKRVKLYKMQLFTKNEFSFKKCLTLCIDECIIMSSKKHRAFIPEKERRKKQ